MEIPRPPSPVIAPRSLGAYQLLESVGLGPRATVYRAIDTRSGQEVAVKVFTPEVVPSDAPAGVASAEQARLNGLLEGARLSTRLKHPSIVPVLDTGVDAGSPYVARSFIRGVPIDRWARGAVYNPAFTTPASKGTSRPSGTGPAFGPPPGLPDVLSALFHACRAVEAAHQQGLLHGNLRPENILVDSEGRPHLTDFALPPDLPSDAAAASEALMDGVPFHAPEVLLRRDATEGASRDVYSLGAILYELLSDHRPFEDSDPAALFRNACRGRPAPPSSRKMSVHQDLDAICLKAMSPLTARRFQTAQDLATALDRFLHHERLALDLEQGSPIVQALTRPWAMFVICAATVAVGLWIGMLHSRLAVARGELDRAARQKALLREAGPLVSMAEETTSAESARAQATSARRVLDRARAQGESAEGFALDARIDRVLGDWDAASKSATEAIRIDPRQPDALRVRAEAAVWRALLGGRWPDALCRWAVTSTDGVEEPPPFPRGSRMPDSDADAGVEARAALVAMQTGTVREDYLCWAAGLTAFLGGDLPTARTRLDEGVAKSPMLPMLRTARGAVSLAQGQGAAALSDLEVATRSAPPSAEAQLLYAIAHALSGDPRAAEADLAEVDRLRPGWSVARRASVYVHAASAEMSQALAQASAGSEEGPEGKMLIAWIRALASDPSAEEGLQEACGRWKDDTDLRYMMAWLLARKGDLAGSLRELGDLLGLSPSLPEALYLSARVHLALEEPEASLEACDRVLERSPAWAAPRATRVRALVALDREEEAIKSIDEVLAAAPGDAMSLELRVEALMHRADRRRDLNLRRADLDEALQSADRAVAASSAHAPAGLLLRARVREARGEDPEPDLSAAEKADAKSAAPLRAHAGWLLRHGRQGEALAALNAAVTREPNDPETLHARVAAYLAAGQKQAAMADLNRVVGLRPFDALALAERGRLHLDLGERDKAKEDLAKALEVGRYRHDMGPVKDLLDSLR